MRVELTGNHAVVTGGGSGIGAATALMLNSNGCDVSILGRNAGSLEKMKECADRPELVETFACDLNDSQAIRDVALAISANGQRAVDILVNNAGIYIRADADRVSRSDFEELWSVNVLGLYELTRALLPALKLSKGTASIINISSTAALSSPPGSLAYSATKSAVISMTETMATEWAPKIRVNCICPGFVDTPTHYRDQEVEDVRKRLADLGIKHPMRRIGQPDDIAAAALYLAAPESEWMTGTTIKIDGGFGLARL